MSAKRIVFGPTSFLQAYRRMAHGHLGFVLGGEPWAGTDTTVGPDGLTAAQRHYARQLQTICPRYRDHSLAACWRDLRRMRDMGIAFFDADYRELDLS